MSRPREYGPWALIAGGSDGLGAAFADELARRGSNLVLLARRIEPLRALADDLARRHRVETRAIPCDLSTAGDLERVAQETDALEIGFLACNAALGPIDRFLDLPWETHQRILDTNCRSAAFLVRALAPKMATRRRGGIVLLTSLASFQGAALVAHYAATKAYLRVLAEGLWAELREKNVDVLACCAGITDTPTYRSSSPRSAGWFAPRLMRSEEVVREALAALGRKPTLVAGRQNRLAGFLTQRLMPRRLAIALTSSGTRRMFPNKN